MKTFKWWMVPLAIVVAPIVIVCGILLLVPGSALYIIVVGCTEIFCSMFNVKAPEWCSWL